MMIRSLETESEILGKAVFFGNRGRRGMRVPFPSMKKWASDLMVSKR
jgi:hypothetical protein